MAQVPVVQTWSDASGHLRMIKQTVVNDIRPLVDLPGHAPLAICREVFCYVDHLGQLYTGLSESNQVGDRFRTYLQKILQKVDPHYGGRAREIYQMFRCGVVHEFEPKVLENKSGDLLLWQCYAGQRVDRVNFEGRSLAVEHLKPVASVVPRRYHLPVSTRCLIDDLMSSIDIFEALGPENERVTAWNRAARSLTTPQPFEFEL